MTSKLDITTEKVITLGTFLADKLCRILATDSDITSMTKINVLDLTKRKIGGYVIISVTESLSESLNEQRKLILVIRSNIVKAVALSLSSASFHHSSTPTSLRGGNTEFFISFTYVSKSPIPYFFACKGTKKQC